MCARIQTHSHTLADKSRDANLVVAASADDTACKMVRVTTAIAASIIAAVTADTPCLRTE